MKKAISGAQILGILGIIAFLISVSGLLVVQFSGNFGPHTAASLTLAWGIATVASGAMIAFGFWWHSRGRARSAASSPDYPDVLGQLFPHAHLMEAGAVHLAAFAFQHGPNCRVVLVVQNRFEEPCDLHISFTDSVNGPLAIKVTGAAVIVAWRDQIPAGNPERFRTVFTVAAPECGNVARIQRRNLLGRNGAQTLAATLKGGGAGVLLGGLAIPSLNPPMQVIFADLAGKLPVQLYPADQLTAAKPLRVASDWQVRSLWNPQKPRDLASIANDLASLFGNVPALYTFPFRYGISADSAHALHVG